MINYLISTGLTTVLVLFGMLAFFGLIVFGVIMLKRHTKFFKKDDKKPDEQQVVKEELNRVLEEVEDEKTIKAMEEYNKSHQEEINGKEDHK